MKDKGFTLQQRQALLDLLVVGMYADHRLASAEDACIQERLARFKFPSDYERQRFLDAAFTRASRHAESPEAMRACVSRLAAEFPTRNLRRSVYDTLEELLASDGCVTGEESQLLAAVKAVFEL